MATTSAQSFGPTSGLLTGWFAAVLFGLAGVVVIASDALGWGALLLAIGLALWCFLARPRIVLDSTSVELRNAFSSWVVPLAAIDDVSVRHSTVLTVRGHQYAGDAVSRGAWELFRGAEERDGVAAMLEREIRAAAKKAKRTGEEPKRLYAVPLLVVLGVLLGVFLVGAVL